MNKPIFRASYTVLNTWNSGNWEMAIEYYFKLRKFITPAMAAGKEYHEKWEKHIIDTNTIPTEFGGKRVNQPFPELFLETHVTDWLDLVGRIDCIDGPTLYEFKTGKQNSGDYARSMQTNVYGALSTLSKIYVDKAEIYHYDQHIKKADMSIVWLTDKAIQDGLEWVETISSEIHSYFVDNKLYEKFATKNN